jgi:putative endonuclease
MRKANLETGRRGEELAIAYLEKHGFSVIEKNWRYSRFEIDVIASKNEMLHFIEVKTRRSFDYGLPEESVSFKKINNLLKAGAQYQYQHREWERVQYNILSIILQAGAAPEFFFIEDIYL